jgi:hypothetical protein
MSLAVNIGVSGDRCAGDLGDSSTVGDGVDDRRNVDGEGEWAS